MPADCHRALRRRLRAWVVAPLVWLVLAVPAVAAVSYEEIENAVLRPPTGLRAVEVTARVAAGYGGGPAVPVTYRHPETGQQVRTTAWAPLPGSRAAAGAHVQAVADSFDPTVVLPVDSDRRPVALSAAAVRTQSLARHPDALAALLVLPLPMVFWLARWRSARSSRRLLARPETAVRMLAALSPDLTGEGRRLHLYAADAGPGAPAVCSVNLVYMGELPLPVGSLPVRVAGSPRPGGRFVAWYGSTPLIPGSRGEPGRLQRPDRLEGDPGQHGASQPGKAPAPAAGPRVTPPRDPVPGIALLAIVPAAAWLALVWSEVQPAVREAEAAYRFGFAVLAEATGATPDGERLQVSYVDPRGQRHDAKAAGAAPADYRPGVRYPAVIEPSNHRIVRLRAEPRDWVTPVVRAGVPTAAVVALALRWLLYRPFRYRRPEAERPLVVKGPPDPGQQREPMPLRTDDERILYRPRLPAALWPPENPPAAAGFRSEGSDGDWIFGPLRCSAGTVMLGRNQALAFTAAGIVPEPPDGSPPVPYSRIDGDRVEITRRGEFEPFRRELLRFLFPATGWSSIGYDDDGWSTVSLFLLRPLSADSFAVDTDACRDWEAEAVEKLFAALFRHKAMALLADSAWVAGTLRPLVAPGSGYLAPSVVPLARCADWFSHRISAAGAPSATRPGLSADDEPVGSPLATQGVGDPAPVPAPASLTSATTPRPEPSGPSWEGFRAGPGPGEWAFGPLSGYPGTVVMGRDSAVRFAADGIVSVAAEGRGELKYSRIDGDYLDVTRRGVPDSQARKLLSLLGWIASDSWGSSCPTTAGRG